MRDFQRLPSSCSSPSPPPSPRKSSISSSEAVASALASASEAAIAAPVANSAVGVPPPLKLPLRVEWECGDRVGLYIDDDEQALLMTAQDGYLNNGERRRSQEELFDCLQKLVIASMTVGLIGIGVAFVFLLEYIAGW